MRILALMILGLMVVGCEAEGPWWDRSRFLPNDEDLGILVGVVFWGAIAAVYYWAFKPDWKKKLTPEEKALRDSVVGEYEYENEDGYTYEYVFEGFKFCRPFYDGIVTQYYNGLLIDSLNEQKWAIVNKEIRIQGPERAIWKEPEEPSNFDVVFHYALMVPTAFVVLITSPSSISNCFRSHASGNSQKYTADRFFRINKDKSITYIAEIVDEKRTDVPKEEQQTLKKIK